MDEYPSLNDLPPEILNLILGVLSFKDLNRVAGVSRKLHLAATNPKFWRNFDFCHTNPSAVKNVLKLSRFSLAKSFVIKRSVKRTQWSQIGSKLGLAVLGTLIEKFEEIDLSGVDLSKKQVLSLFEKLSKSSLKVLKKLRIFSKVDLVPEDVFGKAVARLEEVDLGYHGIKESQQHSLLYNMSRKPGVKKLILHDNICQSLPPFLVAVALKTLQELFLFGMSESQTLALFEALENNLSMKVLSLDNKNLKVVPPAQLANVVVSLEKVVFFDHLSDIQTIAIFNRMTEKDSQLRSIRLDGIGMASVKPNIFAAALSKLEEIDLSYSNLTRPLKIALLEQIGKQSRIRKLNLMSLSLAHIPALTLAKAVTELEEAELSYTHLNSEQVNVIFEMLNTRKEPKLKLLNLVGNNLRSVSPSVLAKSFNKVEVTNLSETRIDGEQVKAVLEEMVRSTKLRKIKMEFSDVCEYEDTLVARARAKGIHFIIEEEDE